MRKRVKHEPTDDTSDTSGFSTSLVRGLQILRSFRPGDQSLGNLELMERTGLPKATISRLTYTLAGLGYLQYDEVLGRYNLGAAAVSLGYSALGGNPIVHLARPFMQELADKSGAAVALGTRDQGHMVYLANCRSESLVTLRLNIGSQLPLWRSGVGLAYLVALSHEAREHLKKRFLPKAPGERREIEALIDHALNEYSELGYVTAYGTWTSFIRAVGVPFTPIDGSAPLAFTCGGIAEIIGDKAVKEVIGPGLIDLKARLESLLTRGPSAD
ncbi:IclR family transcriptional regulator [Agrobacterium sp. LAD9]|uniref:IclR family transcriptional regulator n=1 Tax=Agrobacterium sp. LAD9 TaxID=2055153 RepID=UPI000D1F79F5|nr:IclR family transcriptional regulator [Agrobacterium sp. LAD9]